MKLGVFGPISGREIDPDFVRFVGSEIEARGFESLWVAEHVVHFDDYASTYPYTDDGRMPVRGPAGSLEPLTALTYLAATTATLRLGTGICIVGQRSPVYTAKQVADLDVLSGGRVEFGIGIGWAREEFEALQMPFEHRGARTDDHLAVMKTLWTDETSRYDGRFYRLPPCYFYPKPVQQPHPSIHGGGESDAAMRRVARFCQGWFGMNRLPEDVPEALERLDRALSDAGRSRSEIQITVCPAVKPVDAEAMKRYADLGVDRVVVVLRGLDRDGFLRAADDAAPLLEAAAG